MLEKLKVFQKNLWSQQVGKLPLVLEEMTLLSLKMLWQVLILQHCYSYVLFDHLTLLLWLEDGILGEFVMLQGVRWLKKRKRILEVEE